jgi:predicted regulator of Ras-like GTPase activity (Roadblock/LC7/MglB family)
MGFAESLKRVMAGAEDALGVAMVGMDGIVVDEQKRDGDLDLQSLGAEYCGLMKTVEKTSSTLSLGMARELSIVSEKGMVIVRRINPDYFLLLVMHPEGNFGKGRFLLRREIASLEKEV